jgi:hypothetical protein
MNRKTGYNSTYKKLAVKWLNEALWLIKIWFSASTFVVKIATFAKPETVMKESINS